MTTRQTMEGVILHVLPFQDADRILTLFSPDQGIVKLFLKGNKSKNTAIAPLSRCEFVYSIGKSDLWTCYEANPLDLYLPLRESLDRLESACTLLRAIRASQLPGKPAPELYALLIRYIQAIASGYNGGAIVASFYLKILRYEGMLQIHETGVNSSHHEITTNSNQTKMLEDLAYCRSLSQLPPSFPQDLLKLVEQLFAQQMNSDR